MEPTLTEPPGVKAMRAVLRNWPLPRGKGIVMRGFEPLLEHRHFVMEVEPGVVVRARLDEYSIRWGFLHGYDASAPWVLSRRLIRPGDTVFDIGANQGLWLLSAAHRTGPNGQVHGFEPFELNARRLEDHVALNRLQSVTVVRAAVAEREGTTTFYEAAAGDTGKGRLAAREMLSPGAEVRLVTLDAYCASRGIDRVDFIKVDVEGAEELVFRGGEALLRSEEAPILLFESIDALARSFDSSAAAVARLLRGYGYELFAYDGRRLTPIPAQGGQARAQDDLFALKAHHRARHPVLGGLLPSSAGRT